MTNPSTPGNIPCMRDPWATCTECGGRYQHGASWPDPHLCSPRCRAVRRYRLRQQPQEQ